MIALRGWKLNVPESPIVPANVFPILASIAQAASSIIFMSCFFASAVMLCISAGLPNWWTGMIALISGEISFSSSVIDMLKVSRDMSQNTGSRFAYNTAFAVLSQLNAGTMTLLPGLSRRASSER